jgi:hypothetical protein
MRKSLDCGRIKDGGRGDFRRMYAGEKALLPESEVKRLRKSDILVDPARRRYDSDHDHAGAARRTFDQVDAPARVKREIADILPQLPRLRGRKCSGFGA